MHEFSVASSLFDLVDERARKEGASRVLRVITLDPELEDLLSASFDFGENGLVIKLSPQVAEAKYSFDDVLSNRGGSATRRSDWSERWWSDCRK